MTLKKSITALVFGLAVFALAPAHADVSMDSSNSDGDGSTISTGDGSDGSAATDAVDACGDNSTVSRC